MEQPKKNGWKKIITALVFVYLLYLLYSLVSFIAGGSKGERNKEACEAAERRVQSECYQQSGVIPATVSKTVYENGEDVCVAVKYSLSEEDLKDMYWVKFVLLYKTSNMVRRTTQDVPGLDYDHIPDQTMKELKVLWELK